MTNIDTKMKVHLHGLDDLGDEADLILDDDLLISSVELLKAIGAIGDSPQKPDTFDALELFAHDARATGVPVFPERS